MLDNVDNLDNGFQKKNEVTKKLSNEVKSWTMETILTMNFNIKQ